MPTAEEIWREAEQQHAELEHQPPHTEEQIKACKALIYLFLVTFKYRMYDEVGKIVAQDYIQHNEELGTGRESIIEFAESRPDGFAYMRFKRIIVDGEYVGGQLHVREGASDKEGLRVFELLRYKDGQFLEHWDTMQPNKPASQHRHSNGIF